MLNVVINKPERTRRDKNIRLVASVMMLFLAPYIVMLLLGAADIGFTPGYWVTFGLYIVWGLLKPAGFPTSLTRLPGEK